MRKKVFAVLMSCMLLVISNCGILNVKAADSYYINQNGVSFTREEYNTINKNFNKDEISKMSKFVAEQLKKNPLVETDRQTAYYEVIEKLDLNGNVTDVREREISYMEMKKKLAEEKAVKSTTGGGIEDKAHYETSMKEIKMVGKKSGASINRVTITNTWLKLPKTRSFDVIALRIGSAALTVSPESIKAKQVWDYKNEIEYNSTGDHVRKATKGIGVSMNLSNKAEKRIVNELEVTFVSGDDPLKVYGSYQHAKENVSLKTSKKYTISKDGLGNVIKFNDAVKGKYDGMKGINIKLTLDI